MLVYKYEMGGFTLLNKEILNVINNSYLNGAKDIGESISLLNMVLEELMNKIGQDMSAALNEKNYPTIKYCMDLHKDINKTYEENKELIEYIEGITSEETCDETKEDLIESEEVAITDYDSYKVDQSIPHTLYENFEYKRPVRFKLHENIIEANTWNKVFFETCEILYKLDKSIFRSFVYDKKMNGKKRSYFSMTEDNIRKPNKLECDDIYIETNLSANSIKQIIIKMLEKYNIKLSDFTVYYRADYTELNKR